MTVTIEEAKARLPELAILADQGEEVIIVREGKPSVQMISVADQVRADLPGQANATKSVSGDLDRLKSEFHDAMLTVYMRALHEADYKAQIFLAMVTEKGGLATAQSLINAPRVSPGYTALWERRRLDLTVEAVVLSDSKWQELFTKEELGRCSQRLCDYGYATAPPI